MGNRQRIALLGSTGSIGIQTLDIVARFADEFEITVLTANNSWQRLVSQAIEVVPDSVVIVNDAHYEKVKDALAPYPIKVYAGADAVAQVVGGEGVDVVVNALVGYAGVMPSYAALRAGKKLALANKESLVVAGSLIMKQALARQTPVLPIDSEHSAIFQCLAGEISTPRRLVVTASGGPFRTTPLEELGEVSVEQALRHPNWSMGSKITIDSATMVNKGFEVIEAHWLFGMPLSAIEVVVHPQSVVHSMVEFADGAVKAQLGLPDMRQPIQYALRYPRRSDYGGGYMDFSQGASLSFEPVDYRRFPALEVAFECLRRGGSSGCVMNAANEIAVEAFLGGKVRYTDIVKMIRYAMEHADFVSTPAMDDFAHIDHQARRLAAETPLSTIHPLVMDNSKV